MKNNLDKSIDKAMLKKTIYLGIKNGTMIGKLDDVEVDADEFLKLPVKDQDRMLFSLTKKGKTTATNIKNERKSAQFLFVDKNKGLEGNKRIRGKEDGKE